MGRKHNVGGVKKMILVLVFFLICITAAVIITAVSWQNLRNAEFSGEPSTFLVLPPSWPASLALSCTPHTPLNEHAQWEPIDTPTHFTCRVTFDVPSQKNCLSSSALCAFWMLSQRMSCPVPLSAQQYIDCYPAPCYKSTSVTEALRYAEGGLASETQYPYNGNTSGICQGRGTFVLAGKAYGMGAPPQGVGTQTHKALIKCAEIEIMKRGPVCSTMEVYDDFAAYVAVGFDRMQKRLTGAAYHPHLSARLLGYQALVVLGWTEKAWICQTSWSSWPRVCWPGKKVFFVQKGFNTCGIEECMVAAAVKAHLPATDPQKVRQEQLLGKQN